MSFPRLSIEALAARLHVEPRRLVVVVEGENDNSIMNKWAETRNVSAESYFIGDIECVATDALKIYGGNKSRVMTLMSERQIVDYVDRNIIGIIDLDIDGAINRRVEWPGLYYTTVTCLSAYSFTRETVCGLIEDVFGRKLSSPLWSEVEIFSKAYFATFALKQHICSRVALPSFEKDIRRVAEGGFNWDSYIHRVVSSSKGVLTENAMRAYIAEIAESYALELAIRFHSSVEYLWRLLRVEKVISKTVTFDEFKRHFRGALSRLFGLTPIADLVESKALALQV